MFCLLEYAFAKNTLKLFHRMALSAKARNASVRSSPEEAKQLLVIPIGVDVIVAQFSATDGSFN